MVLYRSSFSRIGWVGVLSMLLVALGGLLPRPVCAATPEQVEQAIDKAKAFLYSKMNDRGNWENVPKPIANGEEGKASPDGRQFGGLTSIATYALLAAGESPQSDKLARPIQFLKNTRIEGIYALGLRCQVWLLLDDPKTTRTLVERDRDTLLKAMHQDIRQRRSNAFGFYAYWFANGPQPREWYDHSVSQYGVLGMWALEQAGAEVPVKYWEVVDAAWRKAEYTDGGWSYRQKGPDAYDEHSGKETSTMTAAGVATLFITQEYLTAADAACKGNVTNENIERGLGWMDKHITEALTGGDYYGMYGIERIGVASGRKYFATTNWYDVGADYLVKNQKPDGSWQGGQGPIPDTCFSILFLTRGHAPVVMNKVQYDLVERPGAKPIEGNWNQRPRDVANFARWMGRQIERDLNWQSVNLKVSVDDLHDAPILYISGNQDLKLGADEIDKLRTFIEQGGMVLGSADCGSRAFSTSFQKLASTLFPAYKMREVPLTHAIFTAEQFAARRERMHPRLLGLSNGVREMMLLVPDADLSRAFQARAEKTREEAYHLAANIFLYAVDKRNLRYKGETYIVKEDPKIKPTRTIELRRLEVGDNWNPEPGGWQRMAAIFHNKPYEIALDVKSTKLDSAGALSGAKVVHLTGTTAFQFTPDQRTALKDFVEQGGTLIIDAAGGSSEFADSAETELKAIFGTAADRALKNPLPPDSAIYHLAHADITQVRYRTFAKSVLGNTREPRIKAIEVKGRPAVFYSAEDLSGGLVGEPVDGIRGYDPQSATEIMRNMILYASGAAKPAAPATAPAKTSKGKAGK